MQAHSYHPSSPCGSFYFVNGVTNERGLGYGRGPASIAMAGRPGSTVNRRDLGDERHIGQCIAQTGRYGRWYTMDSTTAATRCMMHYP